MNACYNLIVRDWLKEVVYGRNEVVYMADSWIDSGGQGLFAKRRLPEGIVVCSYVGYVKRTVDALRTEDKSYLMRLGEQVYVDSRESLFCSARYINDCRNPAGHNVRFDKRPKDACALVVTTRDIGAGEELFVDYGKWYWNSGQPSTRLSFGHLRALRGAVAPDQLEGYSKTPR